MAGLRIHGETLYVIYRNGKPYEGNGRKINISYTLESVAKSVITREIDTILFEEYRNLKPFNRGLMAERLREEFEIIPYGPKGGVK